MVPLVGQPRVDSLVIVAVQVNSHAFIICCIRDEPGVDVLTTLTSMQQLIIHGLIRGNHA